MLVSFIPIRGKKKNPQIPTTYSFPAFRNLLAKLSVTDMYNYKENIQITKQTLNKGRININFAHK